MFGRKKKDKGQVQSPPNQPLAQPRPSSSLQQQAGRRLQHDDDDAGPSAAARALLQEAFQESVVSRHTDTDSNVNRSYSASIPTTPTSQLHSQSQSQSYNTTISNATIQPKQQASRLPAPTQPPSQAKVAPKSPLHNARNDAAANGSKARLTDSPSTSSNTSDDYDDLRPFQKRKTAPTGTGSGNANGGAKTASTMSTQRYASRASGDSSADSSAPPTPPKPVQKKTVDSKIVVSVQPPPSSSSTSSSSSSLKESAMDGKQNSRPAPLSMPQSNIQRQQPTRAVATPLPLTSKTQQAAPQQQSSLNAPVTPPSRSRRTPPPLTVEHIEQIVKSRASVDHNDSSDPSSTCRSSLSSTSVTPTGRSIPPLPAKSQADVEGQTQPQSQFERRASGRDRRLKSRTSSMEDKNNIMQHAVAAAPVERMTSRKSMEAVGSEAHESTSTADDTKFLSQFYSSYFPSVDFDIKRFVDKLTAEIDDTTRYQNNNIRVTPRSQQRQGQSLSQSQNAADEYALVQQQLSSIEYNTAAYIDVFNKADHALQTLQNEFREKIWKLSSDADECQQQYNQHRDAIQYSLKDIGSAYKQLERRAEAANNSNKGAGLLHKLDAKRRNILRGKQLLMLYSICATGDVNLLPPQYQSKAIHSADTGNHALFELADVILQLYNVINDLQSRHAKSDGNKQPTPSTSTSSSSASKTSMSSPRASSANATNTSNSTSSIKQAQRLCSSVLSDIENELLLRFENACLNDETDEMSECAAVLLRFSGKSVIERYVNIVLKDIMENAVNTVPSSAASKKTGESNGRAVNKLAKHREDDDENDDEDFDDQKSGTVRSFTKQQDALYKSIHSIVVEELDVIPRVFNNSVKRDASSGVNNAAVTSTALQNMNVIATIRTLFDGIFTHAIGSFLSSNLVANKALQPADYLQMLYISYRRTDKLVKTLSNELDKLMQGSGVASSTTMPSSSPSASMVNVKASFDALFERYLDTYKQRELSYLLSFAQEKFDYVKQLGASVSDSNNVHIAETDILGKKKQLIIQHNKQQWIHQSLNTHNIIDPILDKANDAVTRMKLLCDDEEVASSVFDLYSSLITTAMQQYLLPLYGEVERNMYPPLEPKEDAPSSGTLDVIKSYKDITDSLLAFYTNTIVPRLVSDGNILAVCENKNIDLLHPLESRIAYGLQHVLSSQIYWISRLLSKQPSSIYKPVDERAVFDVDPDNVTPICQQVCDLIQSHYEAVVPALDGVNLDRYIASFGLRLYNTLVTHLHGYTVNALGATVLSRDMKAYDLSVRQFHLPSVNEKFDILKAVTSIFFVTLDNLQSLLTSTTEGGQLMSLPASELHDFMKMRTDYSQNKQKILGILQLQT